MLFLVMNFYPDLPTSGSIGDSNLPIYYVPVEWRESLLHARFGVVRFLEGVDIYYSIGLLKGWNGP